MASCIAFVFSKAVDPKNPLYLDDDCYETMDWEFGIIPQPRRPTGAPRVTETSPGDPGSPLCKKENHTFTGRRNKDSISNISQNGTKFEESRLTDNQSSGDLPDEEDDDESKASEASDDSSLEPYDLSDDDTDLQRKVSQLADISAALRKPDDPDGVSYFLRP